MTLPDWLHPWRWRSSVSRLNGWRACLVLLAAGAISALGLAPFHIWPAFAAGLIILFWSVDGALRRPRPRRSAFMRGFVFALGYFLAGMFWLAYAFINRGPEFVPMIPPAVLGLTSLMAVFWGFAMVLHASVAQKSVWRLLVFAAAIAALEWLRGHIFSGLPWNLPAYIWPAGGYVSQAASWAGVYGLTFLTVYMLASPALLARRGLTLRRALPSLAGLILFMIVFATGLLRVETADVSAQPDVRIRIVHMALTQQEKWGPGGAYLARQRYLEHTGAPGIDDVTHVLWPEGALPVYMLEDGDTLRMIGEAMGPDAVLLAGVNRYEGDTPETIRNFNAMAVMRFPMGRPRVDELYDKNLLVPFAEMIPLSWLIARLGFEEFARLQFTPGPGPEVLDVAGAPPVMPLVCYEAIFPGFVAGAPRRAAWMYNLSNDAWFGPSSGPRQHVNQARYRSIETGLPMVRATSRGISGVIDPLGRMPVEIGQEEEGAHDVDLPTPLGVPPYQFWGDLPFWLTIMTVFSGIGLMRWQRRRKTARVQP